MRQFLRSTFRRIAGLAPHFGHTTIPREEMLWMALQYTLVSKRVGHYAELGVWRGDTLATCYKMARRLLHLNEMRFYAFDSFEGFPELASIDQHAQFVEGGRAFSASQFRRHVESLGVPMRDITVVQGWFSDTMAEEAEGDLVVDKDALAIVWVDCDLYESTRDALPFVFAKARPGAIIIFDNWFCYEGHPLKGEQLALKEYVLSHRKISLVPFLRFGWHGMSFIYHSVSREDALSSVTL